MCVCLVNNQVYIYIYKYIYIYIYIYIYYVLLCIIYCLYTDFKGILLIWTNLQNCQTANENNEKVMQLTGI